MKEIGENLKVIFQKHQALLWLLVANVLLGVILFIVSLVTLNPNAAVMNLGYSDLGGYRSGSWTGMMSFLIAAVVFGIMNSLLAVRIFQKRGEGMARLMAIVGVGILIGAFVVLLKLLGEN